MKTRAPTAREPAPVLETRERKRRPSTDEIVATEGPPLGRNPRLAIVVDDLGNDPRALDRLLRIQEPITGAVLPDLPRSRETSLALRQSGKEVLLHLPMEPLDSWVNPGPGLIRDSMSAAEIETTLAADLAEVPEADGVNNHMGSKGTADRRTVSALLAGLLRRQLFFLDSRTTRSTVVEEEGLRIGVPVLSRNVFLDDAADERSVELQLDEAEAIARKEGFAVAIGHPHPSTLAVLERRLPQLRGRGITASLVSELKRKSSPLP
jgi:polysaccharide deacetylase 2 family uncharacterized protein YibQ